MAPSSTPAPFAQRTTLRDWALGLAALLGVALVLLCAYAAALFRWPAVLLLVVFLGCAVVAHLRDPNRKPPGAVTERPPA